MACKSKLVKFPYHLPTCNLSIKSSVFNTKYLIDIMQQDKKVHNKKLNFILLKRIGEGIISKNVNINKVKKILTNSISFK